MLKPPPIHWTVVFGWLLAGLIFGCGGAQADEPSRFALLIGVSNYKSSRLANLDGPLNDVTLMRKVLQERFGVPAVNIQTLSNASASHSAIAAAFAELKTKVKRDDFVYVHYSGHGSTITDEEDPRGEDQTWVPFGARSNHVKVLDAFDILDKEIGVWLHDIAAVTPNIIFVSDSCYSATVARGRNRGVRSAAPAKGSHPLLDKLPRYDASLPGVRIGAARDFESAVEFNPITGGPCDDAKRCNGVFTWYWAQALERSQPGDSWQDVFLRARALITTQPGVSQRPQIEGTSERQIFDGGFREAKAVVTVMAADAQSDLRLDAGAVTGVTIGSIYAVQGVGQRNSSRLEVVEVGATDSRAKVLVGRVKRGDLILEVQHAYAYRPIKLYVGADFATSQDSDSLRQLKMSVAALSEFVVVDDRNEADLWAWIVRPSSLAIPEGQVDSGTQLPESESGQPPQVWVVSPQGRLLHKDLVTTINGPDAIVRVSANLQKLAWSREVRGLGTHGNDTPVAVTVFGAGEPSGSSALAQGVPLNALPGVAKFDQRLSFGLSNSDPTKSWYVYLFAVKPNAAVQRIHPQRIANEDEARLNPKERLKAQAEYILNETGEDSIVALVTELPLDPLVLERPGYRSRGAGPRSQLEALFANAARRRGTVQNVSERWGGIAADLTIEKPAVVHDSGGPERKGVTSVRQGSNLMGSDPH